MELKKTFAILNKLLNKALIRPNQNEQCGSDICYIVYYYNYRDLNCP